MRIRILKEDKGLLINSKLVKDDWDFEYSIKEEETIGSISEGPILGYSARIVKGVIALTFLHPVLNEAFKKESEFKVDYVNKLEGEKDDIIFLGSKIKNIRVERDSEGKAKFVYKFQSKGTD